MFTKLGFLSFGGGYPMMALILQEGQAAVGLTVAEFADMTALELMASGPIAINAATYIGFLKAGILGAAVATAGVCVSPFVLTTILYFFLQKFKENRYVQAFMSAVVATSGGILLATAASLGHSILFGGASVVQIVHNPSGVVSWVGIVIVAGCLVAGIRFKVNSIILVLASGALGIFISLI
ncbi:chromate transporter [Ruminococcaceae bacterium OttesenSCG-928-A11]|nr:chromate transporter [Ruminococcaceae bacterium OttesenSCG-928-A11]